MAISIKFTKFDNTPWGFRLAGGSDFPQPLTVIRVTEGSLAECMGLKVGDVVVRLNDQPISSLTHGQAHEELMRAGNNFVLGVQREEDSLKAVEALSEENIVPYKIPLADLPPVFPEKILKEETVIERHEEITCEVKPGEEEAKPEVEPLPDKPKDANSEIVPNQNLTDDEIAQLILEEEELLTDKGVLGVNFKKLKPRVTALKQSKVIEELQNIATAEPPLVEQLRRTSVFLQKPQRPIPTPRKKQEEQEETEVESYKVVIKKQKKRSVTDRLLEKGLLKPEDASTPEPPTPEVNMENIEMERKIEGNDSSIVLSIPLDDSLCSQQTLEPVVARSTVSSSPCLELPIEICQSQSSLDIEPETCTNLGSDVTSPVQLSKRREKVALARRAPNKCKLKSFCTRGHYFRRCLFGKKSHGDVKKAIKVKPSFRERFQESDAVRSSGRGMEQLQQLPRRYSIEKSSKSRIKGRYLETYLKREDNWMRRMVDGLFEKTDSFSSGKLLDRLLSNRRISLRKTRYAEKILVRSGNFIAVRLRSDILKYFKQGCSTVIGNSIKSKSQIGKRLYFKGHYIRRILSRNLVRLIDYVKDVACLKDVGRKDRRRSSTTIKTKGRYLETYLFENVFFDLQDLRDRFSARSTVVSSRKKFFARTRYVERILKNHLDALGLIVNYIRCQVVRGISDSSVVIPGCSSLNSRQTDAPVSSMKEDDVLSNLIRSSKDFISAEVFHRGSRRLSRSSRGSISAGSSNISDTFGSYLFNWLPTKLTRESADRTINDKKVIQDNDRDGRRLSFVPTILYEGLTNRIDVDFTRLVAYAFVPCTSIILLYMYK
ncbi:uncharacterized protein LOC122571958 isoform X1 [Bombus pyrosoma]|uniref:uncharacterized protein LOC122571958 isoform X1 n=1 Tax=Bombus pyrosoma TaxID=396416 RepID=UPI001CB9A5D2|nr:uncharacterized protein LOC122571958 isoform X1 [Bombus pyrosoma]